jgi:hypothetical protein
MAPTDTRPPARNEFQRGIDSDPRFAVAYYSLGRAEMGRRDFSAATPRT